MAIGETISYGINFDEGNERRFFGGGQIILQETSVGYDLEFSFSIQQKQPPFKTVAKMTSQEEDLGFGTSGFPDDIVKQYFEGIVLDIIDSPKFKGILFSPMVDKFSINFPTPEVIPDTGEDEMPIYLIRSSVPNGPKGKIYFEFRGEENNRVVSCYGEINPNSYNQDELDFVFEIQPESSTDTDYTGLSDIVLKNLNSQIVESNLTNELGVISVVETKTEPPQNFYDYEIRGTVIDGSNNDYLGDVYITDNVKSVGLVGSNCNSEPTGDFLLMGEYKKEEPFNLTFTLDGYLPTNIVPFNKNDTGILTYKRRLDNIKLFPRIPSKKIVIEESPMPEIEIRTIAVQEKMKDPGGFATSEILQGLLKKAKTLLLPAVLVLIAKFGIPKAKEALGKATEDIDFTCPGNLADLTDIINTKNKLTKELNNLFNLLNTIKGGLQIAETGITIANVVVQTLSALIIAFPTIPFAPSPIAALKEKVPTAEGPKEVIQKIAEILGKLQITSSSVLTVLNLLIKTISDILNYMSLLDILTQECASDLPESNTDGDLFQIAISSELLAMTQEQENQGNSVISNINGFEMDVIAVNNPTNSNIKRRQAIAKNKAGIILLRGEPSFSSNDQILINELVFYIKMNDLKAD